MAQLLIKFIQKPIKKQILKQKYKPQEDMPGIHSEYMQKAKNQEAQVEIARNKMDKGKYDGMDYEEDHASLKLHINLNGIANLDPDIILGLIQLLKDEANSEDNDLHFFFKVIDPTMAKGVRFADNDQFTLYFDKYSSTADVLRLSSKIDEYLKKHIPENKKPRGSKDVFSVNNFVSARFDNNKLLGQYGVYPFYDLELEKFFKKHKPNELKNLPLGAFEAVFNNLIASKMIEVPPKSASNQGLDSKYSVIVQKELEKMLQDPKKYMENAHNNAPLKDPEASKAKGHFGRFQDKNANINNIPNPVPKLKAALNQLKNAIKGLIKADAGLKDNKAASKEAKIPDNIVDDYKKQIKQHIGFDESSKKIKNNNKNKFNL